LISLSSPCMRQTIVLQGPPPRYVSAPPPRHLMSPWQGEARVSLFFFLFLRKIVAVGFISEVVTTRPWDSLFFGFPVVRKDETPSAFTLLFSGWFEDFFSPFSVFLTPPVSLLNFPRAFFQFISKRHNRRAGTFLFFPRLCFSPRVREKLPNAP